MLVCLSLLGSLVLTAGCGGSKVGSTAAPLANLSTDLLSFAPAVAGQTGGSSAVVLTNSGGQALAISELSLSDTSNFAFSSGCGTTLAAGARCTVTVQFQPQSVASLQATLTVVDNSSGASGTKQVVRLQGTGTAVPVPQATLAPASLNFGGQVLGTATSAQVVTLSNPGTGPLSLSGYSANDPKNFQVASTTCGSTLQAGAQCVFSVVFAPASVGSIQGSFTLTDNAGGSGSVQQTVSLTGTGTAPPAPVAVLTPATLAFPDTQVGSSATPQTLNLSNTGNAPLVISGVTVSDPQNFTMVSNCPTTLAAGASCTLTVSFQPQRAAAYRATVAVTDNSGATAQGAGATVQQTAAVSGTGLPADAAQAALSPAALTFPQTVAHTNAAPQTVTLLNTGTEPLHVASVALSGGGAGVFAIASDGCTGNLAPNASCTVSVSYSPTVAGASDGANLNFTDDALNVPGSIQTVALTGTVLARVDSVENFGDSITCGFYAQPQDGTGLVYSLEGYAGLLDRWIGAPAQNWCRQGDTAADLSRMWVPWNSTPQSTAYQLFTLMIGTNDAYRYGVPPSALQTYSQEVGAAVAWLAIPNSDKVLANTVTNRVGTWSQDVGSGLIATDAGASLSFPVQQAVAGRNLYVVYHVWSVPYGQAGKASIAVDGVVQATVEESQNANAALPTQNGTYDTFLLQTVPLGAVGPHTVTFTSAGPGGSAVGLLWAGVPQQDYRAVDGAPRVAVGLITNSPSGNQAYVADVYNLQLTSLIPSLAADGLHVGIVPTDHVLDPGTDFADLLHPNNSGHAKLAATFEQFR